MTLIQEDERDLVSAVAALIDCNPFLPKRLELERRVLADALFGSIRRLDLNWQTVRSNVRAWRERTRGGGER